MHYAWLDGDPQRNWDLCLSPYRPIRPAYSHDSIQTYGLRTEPKFAALHDLLTQNTWWHSYRNVMLVDEDVFAMPQTWSRFFDWMDRILAAEMAAPALTPNSIFSHPVTVQQFNSRVRRVSFIEGMMPCFRARTLKQMLPTFLADPTGMGWGIDYVWPKLLDYKGIYVVDDTPVTHWRPGTYTRSYWPEVEAVLKKYDAEDRPEVTYEVVL
jgi:hypothetical protein